MNDIGYFPKKWRKQAWRAVVFTAVMLCTLFMGLAWMTLCAVLALMVSLLTQLIIAILGGGLVPTDWVLCYFVLWFAVWVIASAYADKKKGFMDIAVGKLVEFMKAAENLPG